MAPLSLIRAWAALSLFAWLAGPAAAQADSYPTKPIHLLVGYAAGGGTDIAARLVSQHLATLLGKSVVVENRPGAGSNIAGNAVAKASPDGYTLLVGAAALATNPKIYSSMPFAPMKDLAPVVMLALLPNTVIVNPQVPVRSINELITYAKAQGDNVVCASSGIGSLGHLSCELFNRRTGTSMRHAPYKGSTGAIADVVAGRIPVLFDHIPAPLSFVKAGQLRVIAVTSKERNVNLPDVPTANESGLPGFFANTWLGVFAPAGTSPEIIGKLNREINKVLELPEIKERFASLGMDIVGGSPDQLAEILKNDTKQWGAVIEAAGIKVN